MISKRKSEKITVDSILCRDPHQEFSVIDNEVVMLSLEKGEYFALNEVASRIWEIIAEPVSVDKLVEILIDEYSVDYNDCLKDTLSCLSDFQEKEILKLKGD